MILLFKLYILICPFLAVLGQDREIGYWKSLFTLYFLPVIGLMFILSSDSKEEKLPEYVPPKQMQFLCNHCQYKDFDRKYEHCPRCHLDKDGYYYFEDLPSEKFEPKNKKVQTLLLK